MVGESVVGKSYHHQGIKDVGDGLVVTARSDDGVVQAIELPDHPYGIGVQWHPEQDVADDVRLFEGLVDAAKTYRAERAQNESAQNETNQNETNQRASATA